MATTAAIIQKSRETLFAHAGLWLPAFVTIILQDAALPLAAQHHQPGMAAAGLMVAVGAVMIGAGWLSMIGVALRGGTPGMQVFADGVNTRWMTVIAGNFAYWLVILAIAGAAFWYGQRAWGVEPLVAWAKPLLEMTPAQQQAALDPTKLPPAVIGWMNLVAAWFATFLIVNALLLFWQPLAVIHGRGWLRAWADSARLCFSRPVQVVQLGALQLGGLFLARALMATDMALPTFVGVALYVGLVGFFTIAYAAIADDANPPAGETIDVVA